MSSGFLCPECLQDLGSVAALQNHFQLKHSSNNRAESGLNKAGLKLKKAFGGKVELPSQAGI